MDIKIDVNDCEVVKELRSNMREALEKLSQIEVLFGEVNALTYAISKRMGKPELFVKDKISIEKMQWIEEANLVPFKNPMTFFYGQGNILYSNEYIAATPLEKLKEDYEKLLDCHGYVKGEQEEAEDGKDESADL
ncbi:hypothetical protein [Anaerotalea alkaliphila]|uniref:Uncharacterized protein n=1 Tax=Anaerotalea alkaliphila TaxID=2662126 RepID=A0A7X5HXT1_9FIRM|nr:hypothetical protein [Anaerotalea alkaliphila]NDL68486.1 hypothetical protein [Anaerotalea alkaliphila]